MEKRVQYDVYFNFTADVNYTVYAESEEEAIQNGEEEFFTAVGKLKTLALSVDRVEAGRIDD